MSSTTEPSAPVQNKVRRSPSPAITRAAEILSLLAEQPKRAYGASELARVTGVPKSTVLNLCTAMVEAGYLRRSPGGFQLDHRLAELGTAYLKSVAEVEEFYELCRAEASTAHTIQLGVLGDGLNVVYLARHDGSNPLNLGLASEIGRSVPANCTAAGRALLAAAGNQELESRLPERTPLPMLTSFSIGDVDTLRTEIEATRGRRYSMERGETVVGLTCFGAAIRTPHRADGLIAVSFSYPEQALPADAEQAGEALRTFAAAFAARIGGELAF
ncbi:IclR family transcriptional regulator [Okibacterium endophyticum]